jgi:ACT domain-containing protein
MKAIVSVFAKDAKGIIAYVTTLLADKGVNVLDISQTLMQEYFAMIMLVDLADCAVPFDELSQFLKDRGEERGLAVHIQRQDIFDAMHRI